MPVVLGPFVNIIVDHLKRECNAALAESPYTHEHLKEKYSTAEKCLTEMKDVTAAKFTVAKTAIQFKTYSILLVIGIT